jgi:hypothetical protein
MQCEKLREDLLDVLYDEASTETRRRVEVHVTQCPACRNELDSLRQLRRRLSAWKVPGPLRQPVRPAPNRGLRLLAAAAVLLVSLGAALGLSGSELRFEDGRVAFRLGRGPAALEHQLAQQEQRHREQIAALGAALERRGPSAERELLREVEEMIRASEGRQALLLSAGLAELRESTEAQRRYDLARVSASLSYLDGRTGRQLARTSELMGYMLQASEKR